MAESRALNRPEKTDESWITREHGHEFSNIFSIIIANAEMLHEQLEATGTIRRQLDRIIAASRRGEELVAHIRHPHVPKPRQEKQREDEVDAHPPFPVKRILVVDDEAAVVEVTCRCLLKEGLQVKACTDSVQALAWVQDDPHQFDLVIADMDMPRLSGAGLSKKLYALRPDLPMIIVSGHDRHTIEEAFSGTAVRELLTKPWHKRQLLAAVLRLSPPS